MKDNNQSENLEALIDAGVFISDFLGRKPNSRVATALCPGVTGSPSACRALFSRSAGLLP